MKFVFRALLCFTAYFTLTDTAKSDTVHLRGTGSEINGMVTFSRGTFQIIAQFKKGVRQISIGRDNISEVRFNNVKDNPEDDAADWMMNLNSSVAHQGNARDAIIFWEPKDKDVIGTLDVITPDAIKIEGDKSFPKSSVRAVRLD